jgi:hypothetical protein
MRWRKGRGRALLAVMVVSTLAAKTADAADEEYRFDASEFEKKPYELGGYLEAKPQRFLLNSGSTGYRLTYPDGASGDAVNGATATLELAGKYTAGIATARFRTHSDLQRYDTYNAHNNSIYEAVVSLRPDPGATLDIGKVALQWGKGYSSTFVGFVQRPKDPDDPDLARRGYMMATADFIRNLDGPLQTIAFTPVVLPVNGQVNGDFGTAAHINIAAKLYFLYRDTDIDLVYLARGSRPARFGMDFSRNLATNFEVHGEWAHVRNAQIPVVDAAGRVSMESISPTSYMAGLRYLTGRDTTYIVEYYHNGAGYDEGQMQAFDDNVERILGAGTPVAPGAIQSVRNLYQTAYGRPNAMRNYLYAQASQKEPFDLLYLTPSVTAMVNLDDRSFQVSGELLYTGVKNLELRLRWFRLAGGAGTEFGEKPNGGRLEIRLRYVF